MNKELAKGFTLIELLVVITIISFLALYAIPSYRQYVVESKRIEAHNKLLEVASMFEKHYANTNSYPNSLAEIGLDSAYTTWTDYALVANVSANGWVIRANAKGSQATGDPSCNQIRFNNLGQKTPIACW